MSLSMSDMVRFQALELRVAELEKVSATSCNCKCSDLTEQVRKLGLRLECCEIETLGERQIPRRGRPPKNLEERMKAQERDDPVAE